MVLEATVLCLDNSEWMRNGDYTPTRLEAQQDALNLITGAKTQSNPESTVSVIACAGRSPEVLVTLTSDLGKVLSSLHEVKIGEKLNFISGLQVAQLVLKHRQNKNQQQRVVFFVGSPVETDKEELVQLAKRLKKNNIAVDVVNFGEETMNTEKLEAFVTAVNNNNNSHLVTIPPGPHILSDILISSPIINEDAGSGTGTAATGGATGSSRADTLAAFGGVDPNIDPELALALKISMEEERARQESENKKKQDEQKPDSSNANSTTTSTTTPTPQTTTTNTVTTPSEVDIDMGDTDEESALAQAIALSMQQQKQQEEQRQKQASVATTTPTPTSSNPSTQSTSAMDVGDEDAEMALALQMSVQQEKGTAQDDVNKAMEDSSFLNSVLTSLPGVDPNDERIRNVLASLNKPDDKKKR